MKGRHLLPLRGESDLRDPRPSRSDGCGVHAGTPRGHEERAFRRIAFHDPSSPFLSEHRVVAQDPTFEELLQSGVSRQIRDPTTGPDRPSRIEAFPDYFVFHGPRDQDPDVHLPFRERAGLVGTNHGSSAEGLDRGKFPNQCASSDHPLEPQREADCHNRWKSLRDRGHGKSDCRQEEKLDVTRVPEDADEEDQACGKQDRDPDLPPEAVQLLLERRLLLRLLLDESRDRAELGRHAGLDDDRLAAASVDRGAHEHHVLTVAQEGIAG